MTQPTDREEKLNALRLILLDHRDCLTKEGYEQTRWEDAMAAFGLSPSEAELQYPKDEWDTKVRLLLEIDELVEWIEKGAL